MKKSLIILFLILVFTMVGCSNPNNSSQNTKPTETHKSLPGVLGIKQRINIDYIQHIEGDEYELGVIDAKTKELDWKNSDDQLLYNSFVTPDLKVYIENNLSKSYLERKPDEQNDTPLFILHISTKDEIGAGTIKRNCGKGCVKNIDSAMLQN